MPAKSVRTVFAGPPNRALTVQTHYEFILHPETHKTLSISLHFPVRIANRLIPDFFAVCQKGLPAVR